MATPLKSLAKYGLLRPSEVRKRSMERPTRGLMNELMREWREGEQCPPTTTKRTSYRVDAAT